MAASHRVPTVLAASIVALLAAGTGAVAAPPPFSEQSVVVETFKNSAGDVVHYRRGWWGGPSEDRGWGFTKVFLKHGIRNSNLIEQVLQNPNRVGQDIPGSGSWWHERDVGLFEDGRLVDIRTVRAIINYWGWPGGSGQQGIVTIYCVNPDRSPECPEWINEAP